MFSIRRSFLKYIMLGMFSVIFALASATITMAQEADDKNTEENAKENTSSEEKNKSQDKESKDETKGSKSKPTKSPKNFVPSEEISKDLSVSFPVDI